MNITGKNIRTLRQKKGWSQGQVAQRLNISIPAFSKIETGITNINISRLNQIADLFGVPIIGILSDPKNSPLSVVHQEMNLLSIKIAKQEVEINDLQKKLITVYEENRQQLKALKQS